VENNMTINQIWCENAQNVPAGIWLSDF